MMYTGHIGYELKTGSALFLNYKVTCVLIHVMNGCIISLKVKKHGGESAVCYKKVVSGRA